MPRSLQRLLIPMFLFVLLSPNAQAQVMDVFGAISNHHQRIGNTNIFMVIPMGFVAGEYFDGIENVEDKECGIVITLLPGPFSKNVLRFDADILNIRGLEILEEKQYTFGQYRGRFVVLSQEDDDKVINRTSFIFGDENRSYVFHGVAPSEREDLSNSIIEAMESVRYKDVSLSPPRTLLEYVVNEKNTPFKLATVLVNGLIFTIDGELPPLSDNKTIVFFDKSHTRLRIFDPRRFAIDRLSLYPGSFTIMQEENIKKIKHARMHGFSILAVNKEKQEEQLLQNILFKKDGTYYVMTALLEGHDAQTMNEVNKLFKSFRIKNSLSSY